MRSIFVRRFPTGAPALVLLAAAGAPMSALLAAKPASKSEAPANDASSSLGTRLTALQAKATHKGDVQSRFEQEFYSSLRKKTTRSEGTLAFSPPRNFRWEVTRPKTEVYVNNQHDFWKYTEATHHAQRLPPNTGELSFLDVITQLGKVTQKYRVEEWTAPKPGAAQCAGGEDATKETPLEKSAVAFQSPPPRAPKTLLVKLVPKAETKEKSLFLSVDETTGAVNELRILFENCNRTRIVFNDFKEGKIPEDRFAFTPPPGTAVDKVDKL